MTYSLSPITAPKTSLKDTGFKVFTHISDTVSQTIFHSDVKVAAEKSNQISLIQHAYFHTKKFSITLNNNYPQRDYKSPHEKTEEEAEIKSPKITETYHHSESKNFLNEAALKQQTNNPSNEFEGFQNSFPDSGTVYPVFLETNENNTHNTLDIISLLNKGNFYSSFARSTKNIIIATSGLFILNVVSRINDYQASIVLIDNSLLNKSLWENVVKIVCESSRLIAVKRLFEHFQNQSTTFAVNSIELLEDAIQSGESFLSTDQGYQFIQNMFKEGNFCHILLDVTNTQSMKDLHDQIQKKGQKCSLMYMSNLEEWLPNDHYYKKSAKNYQINIERFINTFQPILIDANTQVPEKNEEENSSAQPHNHLFQRVRIGKELQEVTESHLKYMQQWKPLATLFYRKKISFHITKFLVENEMAKLYASCKAMKILL